MYIEINMIYKVHVVNLDTQNRVRRSAELDTLDIKPNNFSTLESEVNYSAN
jgi:hypothetical protein